MTDAEIEKNLIEEIEFLHKRFKELNEKDEKDEKEIRLLSNQINETIKLCNSFKLKDSTDFSWVMPFMGMILSKLPFKDQISLINTLIGSLDKGFITNIETNDLKDFILKLENLIKELSSEIKKRGEK